MSEPSVSRETAPDPPAAARAAFGDSLPLAVSFADRLAADGVLRGLIGPREVPRLWERHLLSSAAVGATIPDGAQVVDLGSGAGLPGIPLALARPDVTIVLVEPMARRVAFLREIVAELGIGRVEVLRSRAADLPPASTDVVTARAVAPLAKLARMAWPAIRPGGQLLAIKGRRAEEEIAEATSVLRDLGASEPRLLDVGTGEAATRVVALHKPR